MKITTFNPLILSKDADEIVKLFEDLGFERTHTSSKSIGMYAPSGFSISLVEHIKK